MKKERWNLHGSAVGLERGLIAAGSKAVPLGASSTAVHIKQGSLFSLLLPALVTFCVALTQVTKALSLF